MPAPQLNPAPFQNIGSTLAGGAVLPAALAEYQGENLGANTQRAIAEANANFAKNKALADPDLAAKLTSGVAGASPELGTSLATLLRAGGSANPEGFFKGVGENQATKEHVTVADPNADAAARVAGAQSLSPAGLANPLTDARQQLALAQAANANAGAGLKGAETLHPELFHPNQYGGGAAPQDVLSYAGMVRRNEVPAPTGTGLARMGGAHFMSIVGSMDENGQPTDDTRLLMGTGAAPRAGLGTALAPPGGAATPDNPQGAAGRPPQPPVTAEDLAPAGPAPGGATPSHGFNAANFSNAQAFDKSVNSIQPNQFGGRLRAGNTLTAHLGTLQHLADAADANDLPLVQKLTMGLTRHAGSDIPTSLAMASHFVGGEMDNFLSAGNSTLEGRKDAQENFNANDIGATQLRSNTTLGRQLMGGQFASMKKDYVNAPGSRVAFEGRLLDPSIMSDWEKQNGGPITRSALPAPGAAPAPGVTAPATVAPPAAAAAPPPAAAGPLPPFNPQKPVPGVDFADEATAQQAALKGIIQKGSVIRIAGHQGKWQ